MAIPFSGFTPPPYSLTHRRQFLDLSQMAEGLEGGFKSGRDLKNEREAGQLAEEWINAGMGGTPGGSFLGDMAGGEPATGSPSASAAGLPTGRVSADGDQWYRAFVEQGVPPMQAAVLTGNVQQESGFNPRAWNSKEAAFGGIQWRLDRLTGLRNFARQRGTSPDDIKTQAAWLIQEGKGPEARAWRAFMAARTPEEANRALKRFIRYGDDSEGRRLAYARAYLGRTAAPAAQAAEAMATGGEMPDRDAQDALASALPLGLNRNTVATIQGRSAPIIAQPDRFTRGSRPPPDAVAAQPDRYTPGQRPGAEALQTLPERRSSVRRVQTTRFDANGNPVAEAGEAVGGTVAGGGEAGQTSLRGRFDDAFAPPSAPPGMDRGRFDAAGPGGDGLIQSVSPDEFVQYLQTITIRNGQVEEGQPPPVPAGIGGRFADAFGPAVPSGIGQRFDDAFAPAPGPAAVAARTVPPDVAREAPAVPARGVPAVPGREAMVAPAAEQGGSFLAAIAGGAQEAPGMDVPPVPRQRPEIAPQIATEAPPAPAGAPDDMTGTPVSGAPVAPSPAALGGRPVAGRYSPEQVAILARMARNPLTRDFALKIAAEHMAPDDFQYFEVGGQIVAVNKRTGQAAPIFGEPAPADREIREDARGVARYVDTGEPVFADDEPPAEDPDLVTLYDEQGREYKAFYNPDHPDADAMGYVRVGGSKAQRGTITRINPETGEVEIVEGADLTAASRTGVQKETINAEEALVRLQEIDDSFKPEYATAWGQGANMLRSWRAWLLGPDNLPAESRAALEEYATWRSRTYNNLNQYLHDMSGAAITPQEAERLRKALPDPQNDDPITFKAKLDDVMRQAREAIARNRGRLGRPGGDAAGDAPAPEGTVVETEDGRLLIKRGGQWVPHAVQ